MSEVLNIEPKKEIFIPEKCRICEYYTRHKVEVLGVKVQTPFSYFLAKGCISDLVCEEKNVQSLFFGVSVDTDLQLFTWNLLTGEEKFKNGKEREEYVDNVITIYGGKLKDLEKFKVKIPGVIEKIVKIAIESELPCFLSYPLPRTVELDLDINPVTEELEIIEKPLPVPPDKMFRLNFAYLGKKFSFQKSTVFIIEGETVIPYKGIWITTKEDLRLYKKIEYYVEQFLRILNSESFGDLSDGIEIGKILAKYIKQCVITVNQ